MAFTGFQTPEYVGLCWVWYPDLWWAKVGPNWPYRAGILRCLTSDSYMAPQVSSYIFRVVPGACKEIKSDGGITDICYYLIFRLRWGIAHGWMLPGPWNGPFSRIIPRTHLKKDEDSERNCQPSQGKSLWKSWSPEPCHLRILGWKILWRWADLSW